MKPKKLLGRLRGGALQNVAFDDFVRLVEAFGYFLDRRSGSHRVYLHPRTSHLLNVQPRGMDAKPYQIRQFLEAIDRYNQTLGEDR